jgi:hypothetical protein
MVMAASGLANGSCPGPYLPGKYMARCTGRGYDVVRADRRSDPVGTAGGLAAALPQFVDPRDWDML